MSSVDPNQFTTPFMATKTPRRDPYEAILPTNPANSQAGKIILITGGSAGIGAAAAKTWAQAGAEGVIITARGLPALEKVASELKSSYPKTKVLAVKADITSNSEVAALFSQIQKTFGRHADFLLNNAGYLEDDRLIGETPADVWWKTFEINLKGGYNMTQQWIQSQPNPKEPTGTILTVSSGRAGLTNGGGSSYNIAKLAEQRLNEHLQLEYPSLRVFTTMPGIALTDMVTDFWVPFAKDHVSLVGMLALYLAQPRADFLKGSMVGVNWDVEELERHKEEILEKKVLQTSWLPVLPFNGGKGLGA
ncbi:related to peroxisomal short-chain alcohol dehydrogenase [Phialocephala subalpina]|uniref:Related to peroxisomal short-chain alcohol dehydrogenase n=1 Tax=Phialocephala subalpina TaxID=576137 RepID=A0A1L7WF79_9HELO|nr:related to peroxisomal short-chain alcohol dehydrogenase [Phialocephala subalpina]